jgi:hypothetical protein
MIPSQAIMRAVRAIHAAPPRLVYVFAGAGSLALYWLHATAGSSRTVLEALDCYAPRALAEAAGGAPAHAVSVATAGALATRALTRAAVLSESAAPLLGVACTAAIATERARRGADRACVSVCGPLVLSSLPHAAPSDRVRSNTDAHASGSVGVATTSYTLTLRAAGASGGRDRDAQEELVSCLVLYAIARACALDLPELALELQPSEQLEASLFT